MDKISIYYQRPGKGLTIYEEEHSFEDEKCLRTFKTLPTETSENLSAALLKQGLIDQGKRVLSISKVYFFNEPFNVLEFRGAEGELLGYYSDIGQPATRLRDGAYEMIDLFLDIWLWPDGRLLELDWDEFDEAVENKVITTAQADLARAAMLRLREEVSQKIYPAKYLK
jgi:predicted RNA-binding protein associated with RNAse of E/G family